MSRLSNVVFDKQGIKDHGELKACYEVLITEVESKIKDPRYKALALTALEESFNWVGKGVRNDVIVRTTTGSV